MRILIITIYLIFHAMIGNGQNVKLEISNYALELDGKAYSTFQYANSSYSASRPLRVFVCSQTMLLKLSKIITEVYSMKQEFTDVWIVGIKDFDQKNISESDQKIMQQFYENIIKYRTDNDLPSYSLQRLSEDKVYISAEEEICKYISCRNTPWK